MIVQSTATIWYFAKLSEADDGTLVEISQNMPGGTMSKRIHREVLPLPMHAAADRILDVLNQLDPPAINYRRKP